MLNRDEHKCVFDKSFYISMAFYRPYEFSEYGKLTVVFNNGKEYEYISVPESLWRKFSKSESSANRVLKNELTYYIYQSIADALDEFTYDCIDEALDVFSYNWIDIEPAIRGEIENYKNKRYISGHLKFDEYEIEYIFDNSRSRVAFYTFRVYFKLDFSYRLIKLEIKTTYDKNKNTILGYELSYNNNSLSASDNALVDQNKFSKVKDIINNFIAEDFE